MRRRCCCHCEDCCDGNPPDEFEVTFDFTDASLSTGCNTCDEEFSGTFVVSRVGTSCNWRYVQLQDCTYDPYAPTCVTLFDCHTPTDDYPVTARTITVSINCISDTHYRIKIAYAVTRSKWTYTTWGGWVRYEAYVTWHWQRDIAIADFTCNTAVDVAVPKYQRFAWVSHPQVTATVACDEDDSLRADALLTAV